MGDWKAWERAELATSDIAQQEEAMWDELDRMRLLIVWEDLPVQKPIILGERSKGSYRAPFNSVLWH